MTVDVGNVGVLTAKGAVVNVAISHVYTKAGTDVYDATNDFETNPFFTNLNMGQESSDSVPGAIFYEGERLVNLKGQTKLSSSTFGSLSGTVSFTLPAADGSVFTKSYPFTITAPK